MINTFNINIKLTQPRTRSKYVRTRTRYKKYIRMIAENYNVDDIFDEKECYRRVFNKRKKISYIRWRVLMLILVRNGLLERIE